MDTTTERLCPRCDEPMRPAPDVPGARLCRACAALWIPDVVLSAWLDGVVGTADIVIPSALREVTPVATAHACPDDRLALCRVRQRGMDFLECEECHGRFMAAADVPEFVQRLIRAGRQLSGIRRTPHGLRASHLTIPPRASLPDPALPPE